MLEDPATSPSDPPPPSSPDSPRLLPDSHNAPDPQVLEPQGQAVPTRSSTMEEIENSLDNSDLAEMCEESSVAEADKENLSSSSPNIAHQLSDPTSSKRPTMLTVVNEKGRPRPSSGGGKGAGSSPAAMNSRGAMLLNLSR